jgi:hypothetical protein
MPIIQTSSLPNQLNELALLAGAGGGILGGKLLGWRTDCAASATDKFQQWCRSHGANAAMMAPLMESTNV